MISTDLNRGPAQHQDNELDEELDAYFEILFVDFDVLGE